MQSIVGRFWKQVVVVALLVGVDAAISLPIMGATYRPFSWMSIAPADAATLYPVIQNAVIPNAVIRGLWFEDGEGVRPVATDLPVSPTLGGAGQCVRVSAQVTPGTRVALQRSTNLADSGGWSEVSVTTATEKVIHLIDTNPISRAVFYRVTQLLEEAP